jgi:Iap family predicted aminopeptidase
MTHASEWAQPATGEGPFQKALDSEYIFEFAERLSQIGSFELGFKPAGTEAAHRAAEMIAEEMRAIGLSDVEREPFPVYAWDFSGARVEVESWEPIPACAFPPTPGTPLEGLQAELVDVGGGRAKDYLGADVLGKVAFMRYDIDHLPWIGTMAYEAEIHGAIGLVFYYLNGYAQHPSGEALNIHNGTARETIPILQIPVKYGERVATELEKRGPLSAVVHSDVAASPAGTGYNVLGRIPGRQRDGFILLGAHYDAWFTGYWDNAVGVGAIMAMARALVESGYQPEHTLIFLSTDAEESGAPDTQFDWLIGCMHQLRSHPEWHGRVSAAFNIDTLPPSGSPKMGFISSPELLPFVRAVAESHDIRSFPTKEPQVEVRVTAWTETLAYAYFGIPPLQPMFRLEELRETIYHTQFDQPEVVDRALGEETVRVYASMLMRLDQARTLPYSLTERVKNLRETLVNPPGGSAVQEVSALKSTLDRLAGEIEAFELRLERDAGEWGGRRPDPLNDQLRSVVSFLTKHTNYLDGADAEDAHALHTYYARDLHALDDAIAHLEAGEIEEAIETLTHRGTGVRGASWATQVSYPVWHRHTVGGSNQGRGDLYWGENRTATVTNIWAELHSLHDKVGRGVAHVGAEIKALRERREAVLAHYRQALRDLREILAAASDRLSK